MESNPTRRGLTHRNKRNYLKKQRHAGKFQIYFLVSRYKFLEIAYFMIEIVRSHDVLSQFGSSPFIIFFCLEN